MLDQVITIGEDGTLNGLMRKSSEGIDLRQFGDADVTRASLIEFDNTKQKFYVKFLLGDLANRVLTYGLYAAATGKPVIAEAIPDTMYFDNYEDAVPAEIETLDAVSLKGLIFTPELLEAVSPVSA